MLRCQLDVEVGGTVERTPGESGRVRVWIDDQLLSGADVFTAEVTPGADAVTAAVAKAPLP